MKILILDPERKVSHRISKDTSGGYGTGNNFGDSLIPKFLKKTLFFLDISNNFKNSLDDVTAGFSTKTFFPFERHSFNCSKCSEFNKLICT